MNRPHATPAPDEHRQWLSDLADGRLDDHDLAGACRRWAEDDDARRTWHAYHLIDPTAATAIAQAMNTGAQVVVACGAETFRTSTFCLAGGTGGMELTNASGLCNCDNSANVATLRPDIGNQNWGGVGGATCSAPSQTITLEFRR